MPSLSASTRDRLAWLAYVPADVRRACRADSRARAHEFREFTKKYLALNRFASPQELKHAFCLAYRIPHDRVPAPFAWQQLQLLKRGQVVTSAGRAVWLLRAMDSDALRFEALEPRSFACLQALCRASGPRDLGSIAAATKMRPRTQIQPMAVLVWHGYAAKKKINGRTAWQATDAGRALFPEIDAPAPSRYTPALADILA